MNYLLQDACSRTKLHHVASTKTCSPCCTTQLLLGFLPRDSSQHPKSSKDTYKLQGSRLECQPLLTSPKSDLLWTTGLTFDTRWSCCPGVGRQLVKVGNGGQLDRQHVSPCVSTCLCKMSISELSPNIISQQPPNLGWYPSHLFLVKLVGLVYYWVYYITTLHIVLDFNSSIVKSIHKCTSCTIDHCSRNKRTSSTSSTHPTWRGRRAAAQCLQTHLPGWTSLPAAGWTSAWSITKHHHFFARASNGFALQGPNVTMSKKKSA